MPGSVSQWVDAIRDGDVSALSEIHRRYWPFLVHLARKRMDRAVRRVADEEDVAQEALIGFYQTMRRGGFPRLATRHDLLTVLVMVTARRAASLVERQLRRKRGAGLVRGESALDALAGLSGPARGIEQVGQPSPAPVEQVILKESYDRYLADLPENLRPFAELFLAGHTHAEIATALNCVPRTVERKLPLILKRWHQLAEADLR